MNSNLQNYFSAQKDVVNNQFLNADNWYADDIDSNQFENANGGGSWNYAESDMMQVAGSSAESLPYVLQIYTTSGAQTSVSLFNAYVNAKYAPSLAAGAAIGATSNTAPQYNYGLASGIFVQCNNAGVTYDALLQQSISEPFTVGKIVLECATQAQLSQPISVTTKDASGKLVTIPFMPMKDPNQNQNEMVVVNYEFTVNGYTDFNINNLLNATNATNPLFIRFYPKAKVSNRRILTRGSSESTYDAPNFGTAQKMVIVK